MLEKYHNNFIKYLGQEYWRTYNSNDKCWFCVTSLAKHDHVINLIKICDLCYESYNKNVQMERNIFLENHTTRKCLFCGDISSYINDYLGIESCLICLTNPKNFDDAILLKQKHDIDTMDWLLDVSDHIEYFIKSIKSTHWIKLYETQSCTFCLHRHGTYKNDEFKLISCDECFSDIYTGEIDILDPCDHNVSQYIRKFFCEWVDMNYYGFIDSGDFCDRKISYNQCDICDNLLKPFDGNFALTVENSNFFVCHDYCIENNRIKNFYNDNNYNDIFTGFKDLNNKLHKSLNKYPK